MALKVATAVEVTDAATSAAIKDLQKDVTDPHGRWCSFLVLNSLWNASTADEQAQGLRERPLAYRMFTNAYLSAQGWRR